MPSHRRRLAHFFLFPPTNEHPREMSLNTTRDAKHMATMDKIRQLYKSAGRQAEGFLKVPGVRIVFPHNSNNSSTNPESLRNLGDCSLQSTLGKLCFFRFHFRINLNWQQTNGFDEIDTWVKHPNTWQYTILDWNAFSSDKIDSAFTTESFHSVAKEMGWEPGTDTQQQKQISDTVRARFNLALREDLVSIKHALKTRAEARQKWATVTIPGRDSSPVRGKNK